ncbi:hypothetical protein [Brevibacillus thermoruber]|uniref:hypothetical protein n=1 Tax=Brevibacillus thermoruber TaxID=33942 RepID=UPI000A8A0FD2|nr:hypothetical protein [Brevibacillus thermoruber]
MDHLCPVCNGLMPYQEACPRCGRPLDDAGRLYDYYGDYSPYLEIDDSKLNNGFPDRLHHHCLHVGWCPACRQEHLSVIEEWSSQALQDQSPPPFTPDAGESPW